MTRKNKNPKRRITNRIANAGFEAALPLSRLVLAIIVTLVLNSFASAMDGDPNVSRVTLDNGLRVVVVRSPLAPVVTTVMNYLVGSNEASDEFPGMAHAQEHMMFRGSPGLTAEQLANIMASMGGKFNADTQQTVTQYFFTVPAEDLDVALHVEKIRMSGILDTQELWEQERGALEQEVGQDYSMPEFIFYMRLLSALFRGTPYAHSPLGSVESFSKTTSTMLKDFYDTWYAPNNAVLVIAGNVQPEQAISRVRELFGSIPRKKLPEKPAIQLQPIQTETFELKTDQPYGMAAISFRMPGYDSNDYPACVVLSDVLSSQRGTLYSLVPQGKALYAGFSLSALSQAGLGYAVAAFPRGADPNELLSEMRRILDDNISSGFPPDLIAAAKRQEILNNELQKDSVQDLAMAWSQAIAIEGRQSPEQDIEAIRAVTPEDVNRVASRYLKLDDCVVAILTPESSGEMTAPTEPLKAVETFTPEHVTKVPLPQWAEDALGRLSVPESTLNPSVTTLPNGLLLIVQPETINNVVSITGHVRNKSELEAPKGQEGVDQVLEQLFEYGSTSLGRVAFQAALDEIGASESAGTDFSLDVLADKLDRGVELLADNELHPALPEEAFKIVQQQVAGTVAGQLQSPGYLTQRALKTGLFPKDDPTLRQATPESVLSLTLDDVKAYYRKVLRPDLTTIVVMGKTTPEEALRVITQYFGDWKAEGPKPDVLLPEVPLNPSSVFAIPDARRVQDKVTLAETLGLNRSNPDYYALQLGNHVLGGGFYATRLFHDLRETTGLVYSVSSQLEVKRTRGLYYVDYACDPSKVARARDIVVQNLREMQTSTIDLNDLNQAKALLLREIPLSESSVDSIAQKFISNVDLDLPLDEPIIAAKHYMELNADDVLKAFQKWIRPDDLVLVTQGPAPK